MAITLMSKIKIVGLNCYEEQLLNALHKTGCVEISESEDLSETFTIQKEKEISDISVKYNRLNRAIDFFNEEIEKVSKEDFYPKDIDLNNVFVSYDEFMSIQKHESEIIKSVEKIEKLSSKLSGLKSEKIKQTNLYNQLVQYENVVDKFSSFKSTKTSTVFFGTIKKENIPVIENAVKEEQFSSLKVLDNNALSVILVVALNENADSIGKVLNENGFIKCPFDYDATPNDTILRTMQSIKEIDKQGTDISKEICEMSDVLKNIKILSDYTKFILEKQNDEQKFRRTSKTFTLFGYVPNEQKENVKNAILNITNAVFVEFSEPTEQDNPPTLTVNNKLVSQAEFITDMYSVPNYREVDPNTSVFFFFMLFMGVIMADIGYGILMIALGSLLSFRIKVNNGAKKLWNIIAISGIFSIIFGLLFNSFFGIEILSKSVLPSPIPDKGGKDGLMVILLGCLGLGVLHIAIGYLYKAINCFKQRDIASGLFDGAVWVLFFIGFVFATFNFLLNYLLTEEGFNSINPNLKHFFDIMKTPGIIIVIASLVVASLTAGRNEKGFGKFSKGFGAIYGLINLMSDILSYARLFGLMLSGMIIAQTFNDIGGNLIANSVIGVPLGILVIILGHTFNIAMGVLGAYIHDSRLQYIEFFSKFYTGEGEKFTPLGSDMQYVYLTK